jgi:hypothetical protein
MRHAFKDARLIASILAAVSHLIGRVDAGQRATLCGTADLDNGSPVSEFYEPPFAYAGTIKKVTITLQSSAFGASDQKKLRDMERGAALAIE